MGGMKALLDDPFSGNPWTAAMTILDRGRAGAGPGVVDAYMAAKILLSIGESLSRDDLSPEKRRELSREAEGILRTAWGVPEDRLGRLRAMKRAVTKTVEWHIRTKATNEPLEHDFADERARVLDEWLSDALMSWRCKQDVIDAALDAAVDAANSRKTMSAPRRWAALHKLAKALRCGTRSDVLLMRLQPSWRYLKNAT